jgi:hypothetical protein
VLAGAAIVALSVAFLRRSGGREVALAPWLGAVLRRAPLLLAAIVRDVGAVSVEAVLAARHPGRRRGRVRGIAFAGGGELPRDRGRRALAEVLGSLPPNAIVLGVDPEHDRLLVHELRPRRRRVDADPLELG